jgi:hypothetical protein
MSKAALQAFEQAHQPCAPKARAEWWLSDQRFAVEWFVSPELKPTGEIIARCLGCWAQAKTTVEPSQIDDALTLFNGATAESLKNGARNLSGISLADVCVLGGFAAVLYGLSATFGAGPAFIVGGCAVIWLGISMYRAHFSLHREELTDKASMEHRL